MAHPMRQRNSGQLARAETCAFGHHYWHKILCREYGNEEVWRRSKWRFVNDDETWPRLSISWLKMDRLYIYVDCALYIEFTPRKIALCGFTSVFSLSIWGLILDDQQRSFHERTALSSALSSPKHQLCQRGRLLPTQLHINLSQLSKSPFSYNLIQV